MRDRRPRARFAESRAARVGGIVVAALVLFAAVAPLAAGHGPLESDFVHGVSPELLPVGPCRAFPLGADRLFRDVLSRLAHAARLSLAIAAGSTAIATVLGAAVGILAGWYAGRPQRVPWPALFGLAGGGTALALGRPWFAPFALLLGFGASAAVRPRGALVDIDGVLMRLIDVLLAFPFLLLVMALGAALDRTSAVTVFVTLGLTGWPGIARVLRAKTMQVRSLEYVLAAQALGRPTPSIMLRHVLPNVAGPLTASATVLVGQMIVAESILSYLGVGISPPTPTWGRMLFEGQDDVLVAPWLVIAPGTTILLAVWGFSLLGEGLRDALDPPEA